jgi:hypothetical protein
VHHVKVLAATTRVDGEVVHSEIVTVRLVGIVNSCQRAGAKMRREKLVYCGSFFSGRDDQVFLVLPQVKKKREVPRRVSQAVLF